MFIVKTFKPKHPIGKNKFSFIMLKVLLYAHNKITNHLKKPIQNVQLNKPQTKGQVKPKTLQSKEYTK